LRKLAYLMRFVSKSVMTGFVNELAILIFMAQLPELTNVPRDSVMLITGDGKLVHLCLALDHALNHCARRPPGILSSLR